MPSTRTATTVAGVCFVVAAVASIPALALYQPALGDPRYVLGTGADTTVLLGGLLEVVTAAAVIGTGVALYPVLRRQGPTLALGYVAGRLLEAAVIVVGIMSTLTLVSLRSDSAGTDDEALVAVARALVALHDWSFLLGPGLAIGVNTLLLAVLVSRSRLVPRWIAATGLVAGPLVLASSTAVLFGAHEQVSTTAALCAFPVFVWEMSLAAHLITRGIRTVPPTIGAPLQADAAVAAPTS